MYKIKSYNKRVISLFIALTICFSLTSCSRAPKEEEKPQKPDTIIIGDMMGREVAVPNDTKNTTVGSTYGVATPFLATLQISDRVLACNFKNKSFFRMCDEVIVNAGNIGTTMSLDSEALAAVNPDVYICKISDGEKIDVAEKLGIPAITLSAEVPEEVIKVYEMLGKVFGAEERAKTITDYLQGELREIDKLASKIPDDKKVTAICLGSELSRVAGEDMLQTIMIERVGGISVVDGIVGDEERYWADCGVEKVFELNPDVIFVTSSAVLDYSIDDLYADSAWDAMKAVKSKNIYQIPARLDSWDMPGPGFILAMYYMMHCMYPDLVSSDMMQEKVDSYYSLLYGKTFSGDEIGYSF